MAVNITKIKLISHDRNWFKGTAEKRMAQKFQLKTSYKQNDACVDKK